MHQKEKIDCTYKGKCNIAIQKCVSYTKIEINIKPMTKSNRQYSVKKYTTR